MKKIIFAIIFATFCLAASASAQEHFLEITKAEQVKNNSVIRSLQRGEPIPGMMVNEEKDVRVGRKLNIGDLVSVPKDILVTFQSSNKNTIETKNNAEFIVSNINDKGESYYQKFGKIRYGVFYKGIKFLVSHIRHLAAVDGTVFEINVDLENREIEFTAEHGTFTVTREYKIRAGDKDIKGLKELVVVSDQEGKQRTVKYKLDFEEVFQVFKNYKYVLAHFREHLNKVEQEGYNHQILLTKNNYGVILSEFAQYDEAIRYFEILLKEKTVSDTNFGVSAIYNNLGTAWSSKGMYGKATENFQKALVIDEKILGQEHPNIAMDYSNLGGAWCLKGGYDKAIEFYQKALRIDEKVFGKEHPNIAIDYNNLGVAWRSKGDYQKAAEYYQKALNIFTKYLGENHPDTDIVRKNIEKSDTVQQTNSSVVDVVRDNEQNISETTGSSAQSILKPEQIPVAETPTQTNTSQSGQSKIPGSSVTAPNLPSYPDPISVIQPPRLVIEKPIPNDKGVNLNLPTQLEKTIKQPEITNISDKPDSPLPGGIRLSLPVDKVPVNPLPDATKPTVTLPEGTKVSLPVDKVPVNPLPDATKPTVQLPDETKVSLPVDKIPVNPLPGATKPTVPLSDGTKVSLPVDKVPVNPLPGGESGKK